MKRAWRRLIAFVDEREDATSLALTRIVAGSTLFCHLVHLLTSGAATFAWTNAGHAGFANRPGILAHFGGGSADNVIVLVCLSAAASLFVAIGLCTRASIFVAWLSFRALLELNSEARSGYDSLLVNTLFLLLLSGCGRALSLDERIFKKAREVARWPRMLVVLQIGMLYGGTAVMKASNGWVPGGDADALWFILHQPMWSRFTALPSWAFIPTQVATTFAWLWELSGPLFAVSVWLRESAPSSRALVRLKSVLDRVHFRELWLVAGVGVHIGIEVSMEVGAFFGASLALYPCALRPHEWRELAARVRSRIF
jgi:hypothetical protein